MVITFEKINLDDKANFDKYLSYVNSRSCEYTFANILLWSRHFNVEYAIIEDMLVLKYIDDGTFAYPIGNGDRKKVIEILLDMARSEGNEFKINTSDEFADEIIEILAELGEKAEFVSNRNSADYVYLAESLRTLAGKKLHGKRNHINKFKKTYLDWSYEEINESNVQECYQMSLQWCKENNCADEETAHSEICVVKQSLLHMNEMELIGGLLRVDGKVVAFTIGEPACDDTFIVHIEKALQEVQGAYTMINQQFIENSVHGYTYINREEDLGIEGLRKAKLSYYPEMLVEKGAVVLK